MIFLFSPILLLISILIKIDSNGPIIFSQFRVGKNKKTFRILKFRTMVVNTRNSKNLPLFDSERITKVGRFLRKFSLDELPQFINVLKGEMSLIGPRPILLNDLPELDTQQEKRFLLLPGLSSWTAINGRNSLKKTEKYNLEKFYVANISLYLDSLIFFKTIFLILSTKNIDDKINNPRIAAEIIEPDDK
jgi:lipopolysaccharide/colanic/teichoic acid biosynthesis glycosyltransferase